MTKWMNQRIDRVSEWMMNECGNKWILFAEGLCCVWEWNDCVRDQRPEPSHTMTDGQCWWFLSIRDPELRGDWQYGVWGGLRLIVFTPQSSYQYTDTHQTWDQLWMINSTSELYLSIRSIFHSRSLFLAFLPSTSGAALWKASVRWNNWKSICLFSELSEAQVISNTDKCGDISCSPGCVLSVGDGTRGW